MFLLSFSSVLADEPSAQTLLQLVQKNVPAAQQTDAAGSAESENNGGQNKNNFGIFSEKSSVPETISDTQKIEDAAAFASDATGVRKDFLMGMLVVESDLGRNSGKCTYQEVEDDAKKDHDKGQLSLTAWNTFTHRRDIIKDIADSLGYDYSQLKVSCNPGSAYAGTGGAMGVPQFMPDTWLEYKDRVAAIVGKDNPDPWNEKDGAVAMALKLSDVSGVTTHSTVAERNAAKMYLSGNTSLKYDWYANQILYWSKNYDKLIG